MKILFAILTIGGIIAMGYYSFMKQNTKIFLSKQDPQTIGVYEDIDKVVVPKPKIEDTTCFDQTDGTGYSRGLKIIIPLPCGSEIAPYEEGNDVAKSTMKMLNHYCAEGSNLYVSKYPIKLKGAVLESVYGLYKHPLGATKDSSWKVTINNIKGMEVLVEDTFHTQDDDSKAYRQFVNFCFPYNSYFVAVCYYVVSDQKLKTALLFNEYKKAFEDRMERVKIVN